MPIAPNPVATDVDVDAGIRHYAIGGVLHIATVDEPPDTQPWLASHFGWRPCADTAAPDLTVRFVERFEPTPFRRLELNDQPFGYDAGHLYLIGRRGARARLAFDRLGDGEELVCERAWSLRDSAQLLRDIVAVLALRKGWLMLHGAAFEHEGRGIVIAGWQSCGKSEFLYGMRGRARFISDEPTLIEAATGRIVPSLAPLHLWEWQIRQLNWGQRLPPSRRMRIALASASRRLLPEAAHDGTIGRLVERVREVLATIGHASVTPQELFETIDDDERITMDLAITGAIGPVEIREMPGELLARKMAVSQRYERRGLSERYAQFRYAFPDRRSDTIDEADRRELALLTELFAGRTALELIHPYPGELHAHGDQVQEAIRWAAHP